MKQLLLSTALLAVFLLVGNGLMAQGKSGFLHMDKDQKKQEKKNQYVTIEGQPDTQKIYNQYGEYQKDTIIYSDQRVKHGVWEETDSNGNRVRRRYKRGDIVEEERYKEDE